RGFSPVSPSDVSALENTAFAGVSAVKGVFLSGSFLLPKVLDVQGKTGKGASVLIFWREHTGEQTSEKVHSS
ncbi:MAG: hypothetical protein LBH00_10495, partial [Planctomycetaceae bacterium]|nr:hypothetical protein [Planctomycetaceae bacterium]